MAGWTNTYENLILDRVFGGATLNVPANVYIALYTTPPADDGTGGAEVSTTGTGYTRVAKVNTSATWNNASSGSKSNAVAFTWSPATASWGTIQAAAVFDAATGGVMIAFGSLTSSMVVGVGAVANIAPGDFVITQD